jgi:hypothetical protein
MFLIALTTTVMMAKNVKLPKEHYQCSREFFKSLQKDENVHLGNIIGHIKRIDEFEKANNIDDEYLNESSKFVDKLSRMILLPNAESTKIDKSD